MRREPMAFTSLRELGGLPYLRLSEV